jgi:hypothetical protein
MITTTRTKPVRGKAMSCWITGLLLALIGSAINAEPESPSAAESTIEVECHGKLRCGVVAIGGETTGTTLTFDGVPWELKIDDDKLKEFANSHHRKLATATGVLRRVKGTERPGRWIVEVRTLTERDSRIKDDGVSIIARGSLEKVNSSEANLE